MSTYFTQNNIFDPKKNLISRINQISKKIQPSIEYEKTRKRYN